MNKIAVAIVLFLAFLLVDLQLLQAEFHCEAKVSYTAELAPRVAKTVVKASTTAGAKESPAPTVVPENREITVSLAVVEAKGEDQEKAKAAVQRASGRQAEIVREQCRERHENVGSCIASKFEASANTLRSLGFQARKALEEALQGDCEAQRGVCKKTEVGEPVCHEIVVKAVESASPVAEGKDDKKKGKK